MIRARPAWRPARLAGRGLIFSTGEVECVGWPPTVGIRGEGQP